MRLGTRLGLFAESQTRRMRRVMKATRDKTTETTMAQRGIISLSGLILFEITKKQSLVKEALKPARGQPVRTRLLKNALYG